MSERPRVNAHVKQDRRIIDDAESATPWAGSTDVSALTTSVSHREGSKSVSFAKSGTTQTYGQISNTFDTDRPINLVEYYDGKLVYWIYLSSLTNIASVSFAIGTDANNNFAYDTLDSALIAGWNKITHSVRTPTTQNGNGVNWASVSFLAVRVNFDASGNTLTGILVDSISIQSKVVMDVEGTAPDGDVNAANPLLMGAEAQDPPALPTATTAGKIVRLLTNLSRSLLVTLSDHIAGEDLDAEVMKVEQRNTRARATADSLLVTGAGFLHTITISPLTATPTAGLLTVYDNTAESGTVIYSEWIFATTPGHTVVIDSLFGTGVYVGFDGTLANVACVIGYRQ